MSEFIIKKLPRAEGILKVIRHRSPQQQQIYLESGRSTHLENRLIGRYPLEAIHQTQLLSLKTGIAHALAAVSAIESYLKVKPTEVSVKIRHVLLQISTLHSHIHHFYWELLPDFLNIEHFRTVSGNGSDHYLDFTADKKMPGDLTKQVGLQILDNLPVAADCLKYLQMIMAALGGKFPIVMNLVPGGISNANISRPLLMSLIRNLEKAKKFIEVQWPKDVKAFIQDLPDTVTVLVRNINLLSFGSAGIGGEIDEKYAGYSDGVLLDGKLGPVNELKITESNDNTYYLPIDKNSESGEIAFNFQKTDARTWIRGARYDGASVYTGSLSRMLVTHFAGGNMEISDRLGQMMDDLGLSAESPNCMATRLLAAVFEGRFYLRGALNILLDFNQNMKYKPGPSLEFAEYGVGMGKIEAPSGALLHRIFIEDNKIVQYRIITPMNWNFSPSDRFGKSGIVEQELNRLNEAENLSAVTASRVLHSYNVQVLDGTK